MNVSKHISITERENYIIYIMSKPTILPKDKKAIVAINNYLKDLDGYLRPPKINKKLIDRLMTMDPEKEAEEYKITKDKVDKQLKATEMYWKVLQLHRPTKLDITKLSTYSRNSINSKQWQEKHKELYDAIKEGYEMVERIISKIVIYGTNSQSIGSMFYAKAALGWSDKPTDTEDKIEITIGANNGNNTI